MSYIGYVKDRGHSIGLFKKELRDRKLPERTVKEIPELGRFVIAKAKTWTAELTRDGAKIDPIVAFQKWSRDDLAKLLASKGFDTLGKIRAAKYPKGEFADVMIAKLTDMKEKKKADDIIAFFEKFKKFMADNPNLAAEAEEAETEEDMAEAA